MQKTKFLIVVPAHNESMVIQKALSSVSKLAYTEDLYDVVVIADNCNDDTAEKVHADGKSICLIRKDAEKTGKGYALQWAFREIEKWAKVYDAYVVMDADTEMDIHYLTEMDRALQRGADVLQGFVQVVKPERSAAASLIFLGWSLNQRLRHAGTSRLGYFAFLLGNGFCIRAGILRQYGWNALSILEDVEYGLMLRLLGFKIRFVAEAKVYAQNPSAFKYAASQRVRWDQGRFQIMKQYLPMLIRDAARKKDSSLFLSGIELLVPPFTLLVFFMIAAFMMSFFLSFQGMEISPLAWWLSFSAISCYTALGLIVSNAGPAIWKSLLYAPFFMVWRIAINTKGFFIRSSVRWTKTEREDL